MSDFTVDEKINIIREVFSPEWSEENIQDLQTFFTRGEVRFHDVFAGDLLVVKTNRFVDTVTNSRNWKEGGIELFFINIPVSLFFTLEQIEFLRFFDIFIEAREHSFTVETRNKDLELFIPVLEPDKDTVRFRYGPKGEEKFHIFLGPNRTIGQIITDISRKTHDPEVMAIIESYLKAREVNEVRQALLDLEAQDNTVAIALLNILDESTKRFFPRE